ncbi:Crp/Fnr family transcriptional regulator [Pseudotenacibaculum sp. MALMAid0570]|uniref:Crp/Fnr family transcriptional regulator n=1 Tax=Pseudotenacibaculum sp. MALMAid0570 TaxID=3143938 RepID=UPI0032DEB534
MKKLIDAISEFSHLSEQSKRQYAELLEIKELKKKDKIANLGEIPTKFFILTSGIVRSYVTDEKGKEFIRSLYIPTRAIGAFTALIQQKPTEIIYECLTDCKVLVGDFQQFKKLAAENLEIATLYNKVLERIFIRMEKRIFELSILNAKQRYLKLKKHIPDIENLIPQYHIASYLNITPVQLSRIRKDLYKKILT